MQVVIPEIKHVDNTFLILGEERMDLENVLNKHLKDKSSSLDALLQKIKNSDITKFPDIYTAFKLGIKKSFDKAYADVISNAAAKLLFNYVTLTLAKQYPVIDPKLFSLQRKVKVQQFKYDWFDVNELVLPLFLTLDLNNISPKTRVTATCFFNKQVINTRYPTIDLYINTPEVLPKVLSRVYDVKKELFYIKAEALDVKLLRTVPLKSLESAFQAMKHYFLMSWVPLEEEIKNSNAIITKPKVDPLLVLKTVTELLPSKNSNENNQLTSYVLISKWLVKNEFDTETLLERYLY